MDSKLQFQCYFVQEVKFDQGGASVFIVGFNQLSPDPNDNLKDSRYLNSGQFQITIADPEDAEMFRNKLGHKFYADFTPVENNETPSSDPGKG